MNECPSAPDAPTATAPRHSTDGALAALAGFEAMTVRRLRLLLAHHGPAEAYEVAAGRDTTRRNQSPIVCVNEERPFEDTGFRESSVGTYVTGACV